MNELVEARSGSYHDSVTLMRVSRRPGAGGAAGVAAAMAAMGTEATVALLSVPGPHVFPEAPHALAEIAPGPAAG